MHKCDVLKTVPFAQLEQWNVSFFLTKQIASKFEKVQLKKCLNRYKEAIKIVDSEEYTRITVRMYGLGVTARDTVLGASIGTKRQFLARPGQLILSRIDARNGAFGTVPDNLDGAIVTNDFWLFELNDCSEEYIKLVLSSDHFKPYWQSRSSGTTNRQRITEEDFLNSTIPLPSLEEQNKIVKKYRTIYSQAEECELKANEFEDSLDKIFFEDLGIEFLTQNKDESKYSFIKLVHYKNLVQWSVKKNTLKTNPLSLLNSKKYKNKVLVSVVEINPTTSFDSLDDENVISFLPMECISDTYGELINRYEGKKEKSKGYTRFKERDILWAKITPCMQNGKCAIATDLLNAYGYGSTEYHVIRANENQINTEFLYHILRTKIIREVAQSFFTGSAGQQRVGADFLENLSVPIPPLEVQQEISDKISKIKSQVKELRLKAQTLRLQAKQEFEREVFNE